METKSVMEKIADFEKNPSNKTAILVYKKWISLSDAEKQKCWTNWTAYYDECWDSPPALLYREMKEAYKRNDWARFKELREQNREIRDSKDFIAPPISLDPYWVMHNQAVNTYKRLMYEKDRDFSGSDIFS
jgi:hypothetical protein